MAVVTKNTMLYVLVPKIADPTQSEVLKVGCPKTLETGGDPVDEIDVTCLDSDAREYVAGLGNPDTATFDIDADPRDPSHIRLYQLSQDVPGEQRPVLDWAVGWSDGTAAPSVNATGDAFELPDTRTWFTFHGYVSNFPFSFAVNSTVQTTVSIRRSGAGQWIAKV